jgi:predicted permease
MHRNGAALPMLQDLKYTLRLWAHRPWETAFAIAALAVGIGASTGVFSVVNGLLLRSLPFRNPQRLALVRQFIPPHSTANEFHEWSAQTSYLSDAALFEEFDVNLGGAHIPSRAHVAQTSSNFFSVLGTQPVLGRGFTLDDDENGTGWGLPGRNAVAVIGYGLWQQMFGADRKVLGSTIRIDGNPLTVVGIAPPGFDFPSRAVLWKPAAFSPGNNGWSTVARLKPGVSWADTRAAFAVEVKRQSAKSDAPDDLHASITSLQNALAGPAKNASFIFLGAVLFVLLIACANVGIIIAARTTDRAAELSLRSALGATGGRLLRQLFTECLFLSFVATLAGLTLAYWTTSLATKVVPPSLATESYSILDARVLGFTVVVSVMTALTFGMLPSLYLAGIRGVRTASTNQGSRSRVLREVFVGLQVTLTIILLAASMSLGRAFIHLMKIDRGYDVKGIVTASVSLDGTTHQTSNRRLSYFEQVLERLRKLPGVHTASATEFLPLYANAFVGGPFGLDGRPAKLNSTMVPVMSGYFATMGGRILWGREFTDAEVHSGAKVAVVNERFAAQFGSPEDALGHQLTNDDNPARKIVGVARGMEFETDPTLANSSQVFVPADAPGSFFSTFVVRVDGRAENYLAQVRDTIESVDPQVPVFGMKTMGQRLDEIFAGPEVGHTAAWSFSGLALLLSLTGIYGITHYAVAERTREMGIRIALGSTPLQVRSMLLRRGMFTIAASAPPAIVGTQIIGKLLESFIQGARPVGFVSSATLLLFFMVIGATGIWIATRRIGTLDVNSLLRSE